MGSFHSSHGNAQASNHAFSEASRVVAFQKSPCQGASPICNHDHLLLFVPSSQHGSKQQRNRLHKKGHIIPQSPPVTKPITDPESTHQNVFLKS